MLSCFTMNGRYSVNKSPYSLQFVQLSKTSPIRSHETLKSLDGALQLVGWLQRFLNNMNNMMMKFGYFGQFCFT